MKLRLCFLPMLLASILLTSATTNRVEFESTKHFQFVTPKLPPVGTSLKEQKLNFIERLLLKYAIKRVKKVSEEDIEKANKQASTSLSFGIASIGFLLLGLFIPLVKLAAIPTGIVALTTGNTALKEGTKERSKARTGRALGLSALITVGLIFLLALLVIAAFFGGWN